MLSLTFNIICIVVVRIAAKMKFANHEKTGLSKDVTFLSLLGLVTASLSSRDCHNSTEEL